MPGATMAGDDTGKEPTPWELMRSLERIESSVRELSTGVMTAQVFAVEKASLVQLIGDNRGRIGELDVKIKTAVQELDAYKAQIEDQRGKMRLMVYGLILGPVAALIVTFIASGGLAVGA